MSKEIVFSHSAAKGCWVSEEITQASMAYIQVTRKEPGFLRVYTYAEGQRPVLVHVTQQANAVVFADYQPADVRLLVESETEVTSAVVCQDSTGASDGDTYTKTEADSRFQLKGDYATNSSVDTKLADYATTASVNTELDKKADKAKAFTTDTVSTAPSQFVAGPATTQGNLHLRKIDISDIPDLSNKYLNKEVANGKFSNKVDIKGASYIRPGKSDICAKMVTVTYPIGENEQVSHFNISFTYYSGITNISVEIHRYSTDNVVVNVNDVSTEIPHYGISVGYLHNEENNKIEFYCIDSKHSSVSEYDIITAKVIDIYGDMQVTWDFNIEDAEYDENITMIQHMTDGESNQVYATPTYDSGIATFRHLVVKDIPDLSSKYQALTKKGNQARPRIIDGLYVDGTGIKTFIEAIIPSNAKEKNSPNWYFATDGTLQDITTKIPKITLDDTVSTTSSNGVKNSVITKYVDGKVIVINSSITDIRTSLESTQTDFVALRNKVNAMPKVEFVTQEKYTADKEAGLLDANTIYYING